MPAILLSVFKLLSPVWKLMKSVLTITIPIPIFVMLLISAWWYYDKNSAIKQAVEAAITELVAGAELAAKDAVIELKDRQIRDAREVIARQNQRLASERRANDAIEKEAEASVQRNKELEERLNEISKGECGDTIDERFFDLLPK